MSGNFFLHPLELSVEVIGAKNLVVPHFLTSSLCVSVYLDGSLLGSAPYINRSTSPTWKKTFKTSITHTRDSYVYLKVFNNKTVLGHVITSVHNCFISTYPLFATWTPLEEGQGSILHEVTISSYPDVHVFQPITSSEQNWWKQMSIYSPLHSNFGEQINDVQLYKNVSRLMNGAKVFHSDRILSLRDNLAKDICDVLTGSGGVGDYRISNQKSKRGNNNDNSYYESNESRTMWVLVHLQSAMPPRALKLVLRSSSEFFRLLGGFLSHRIPIFCSTGILVSDIEYMSTTDGEPSLLIRKDHLSAEILTNCTIETKLSAPFEEILLSQIDRVEIDGPPSSHINGVIQKEALGLKELALKANVFSFRPPSLGSIGYFKMSTESANPPPEYHMVIYLSDSSGTTKMLSSGWSLPSLTSASKELTEEKHYFHSLWNSCISVAPKPSCVLGGFKVFAACDVVVDGVVVSTTTVAEQYVSFRDIIRECDLAGDKEEKKDFQLSASIVLRNEKRTLRLTCTNLRKYFYGSNESITLFPSNYCCKFGYKLIAGNYSSSTTLINLQKDENDASSLNPSSNIAANIHDLELQIIERNDTPVATHVRLLFFVYNVLDLSDESAHELGYIDILISDISNEETLSEYSLTEKWENMMTLFDAPTIRRILSHRIPACVTQNKTLPTAVPIAFLTDCSPPLTDSKSCQRRDNKLFRESFPGPTGSIFLKSSVYGESLASSAREDSSLGLLYLIFELSQPNLDLKSLDSWLCYPNIVADKKGLSPVSLHEVRYYSFQCTSDELNKPLVIKSIQQHESSCEKKCFISISGGGIALTRCADFSGQTNRSPQSYKESLKPGSLRHFLKLDCSEDIEMSYLEVFEVYKLKGKSESTYSAECWLVDDSGMWQYPRKSLRNDNNLAELSSIYSISSEWIQVPTQSDEEISVDRHTTSRNNMFVREEATSKIWCSKDASNGADTEAEYDQFASTCWEYGSSMANMADPLLRCSEVLPGCEFKRRRWIRYVEKYALPIALFSDLHNSLADVMPLSLGYSGPYEYSHFHKPQNRLSEGDAVLRPKDGTDKSRTKFVPPFLAVGARARFGSFRERSASIRSLSFRSIEGSPEKELKPGSTKTNYSTESFVNSFSDLNINNTTENPESTTLPCLVVQTAEPIIYFEYFSEPESSRLLPISSIVTCEIITADVVSLHCRLSRSQFFDVLSFVNNDNEGLENSIRKGSISEEDDLFLFELHVRSSNVFELSRYLSLLSSTHFSRTVLSNIVPTLSSFKRRVIDRERMTLITSSNKDMEFDRAIIWKFLRVVRERIRNIYHHSLSQKISNDVARSDGLWKLKTLFFSSPLQVRKGDVLAEINSNGQFQLDATSELALSLLKFYHDLVVTEALGDVSSDRMLEICVAEEALSTDLDLVPNLLESNHNSYKSVQSADDNIVAVIPDEKTVHSKSDSSLDYSLLTADANKRKAVRYSYTQTICNPSSRVDINSFDDNLSSGIFNSTNNDVSTDEYNPVVAPELFTTHQKYVPLDASSSVEKVIAFSSHLLDETEARILLCSTLPRLSGQPSSTKGPTTVSAISDFSVILNMLLTRCIRQLVMVVSSHIVRPAEFVSPRCTPSGFIAALSFFDNSNFSPESPGNKNIDSCPTSTADVDNYNALFSRYSRIYDNTSTTRDEYLPLSSFLVRSNGRLFLIAKALSTDGMVSVTRSALLSFFIDFQKVLKWELRPRADNVYRWCLEFCRTSLYRVLEVRTLYGSYLEKKRSKKSESKQNEIILTAAEEYSLILQENLFAGARKLFLQDISTNIKAFEGKSCSVNSRTVNENLDSDVGNNLLKPPDYPLRFSREAIIRRYNKESLYQCGPNTGKQHCPLAVSDDSKPEKYDFSDETYVDSRALRNISFLNDIRHVSHRGLKIFLVSEMLVLIV